jgi:hypothetical protein
MTEPRGAATPPQPPAAGGLPARWSATLNGLPGFVIACIAWVLVRPYQGVRHDAILYLGQALKHLAPDVFGRDVFFSRGSQDQFTIVSAPLAWCLSHAGTAGTEMTLTVLCNLAFVGAAWWLADTIAPSRRGVCTLGVVMLSHAYGRLEDFNYGENFFTARSLAEPLVLLALAAWLRRRHAAGLALFACAALVHPLVALPALAVAWLLRVRSDRRWLWGLALAVPVLALAAAGVTPFGGLFARYDDTWWQLLTQFDAQVRLTTWRMPDVESAALDLLLLGVAATLLQSLGRQLALAVIVSSASLLAVAFLGGDVARDVLVVQLQLWRVLWLAHALAMLCLPALVLDLWREGDAGRTVAVAAATAVLAVSWTIPYAWAPLLWLPLALLMRQRAHEVSAALARAALGLTLVALAGISILLALTTWRLVQGDAVLGTVVFPLVALLSIPTLGLLGAIALAGLLALLPMRTAAPVAGALGALAATQWDQRSEWTRTLESFGFEQHPFARVIPRTAQVYWHLELAPTWLMLDRASFVSEAQASGIVFNRATALDVAERSKPMNTLLAQQVQCQMAANAAGLNVECQPAQALVEATCRAPLAPDFMVFDARYPRGLVAQWNYRIERGAAPRTAFLYDCAAIR